LAQAKMQLLKYDEAIYHLERIIHQNDEFVPAIYLLGRAYVGKGNMAAGARILVKLQKMNPAWGELLDRSIRLPPFRPVTKRAVGRARINRID
ncbi:MAG TPA: tetratricopeptide repeat protein, partial [Rhodothermia bacterium]|nr:tetratricopeptide repeat protein [Rhodothermia bacterium]